MLGRELRCRRWAAGYRGDLPIKKQVCRQATACSGRHEDIWQVHRGDGLFPGASGGLAKKAALQREGAGTFVARQAYNQLVA